MTEPTSSDRSNEQRDVIDARRSDLEATRVNLERAMRSQFADAWSRHPDVQGLPIEGEVQGGVVWLNPGEPITDNTREGVYLNFDRRADGTLAATYGTLAEQADEISSTQAAAQIGISTVGLETATRVATALVEQDAAVFQTHAEILDELRSLRDEYPEVDRNRPIAYEYEPSSREDEEDFTTEADRYLSVTYYEARWVEQTAETRALLRHGQVDEIRELIEEIDQNLRDFDDGGYPPDSDELYGIYTDAITRAAIPYGEPPISVDEVARQLRNVGHDVPTIDLATIRDRTGITPLHREWVTSKLDGEAGATSPALNDVAAARLSIRRAIASITDDSAVAQTHLQSANRALTEAVQALRPDQVHPGVTAAQESVQQASEKVAAVTETAARTDAEVTLYTKSDCPGCFATKRALDKAGVEYDEINLEQHPELLAQFKRQGMMQAPIVETKDGERWAGYNPAKLKEHGLDYRSRQQRGGDSGRDPGYGR